MKKMLVLIMSVASLSAQAKQMECMFQDGTLLKAELIESNMSAELAQISIQYPGKGVHKFSDKVKGVVYTNISGDPNDSVVLSVWKERNPENKPLFSITGAIEGNPYSGSVVQDYKTGSTLSVICKEIEAAAE